MAQPWDPDSGVSYEDWKRWYDGLWAHHPPSKKGPEGDIPAIVQGPGPGYGSQKVPLPGWETMEIKPGWKQGPLVPLPGKITQPGEDWRDNLVPLTNEKSSKWGDAVQLAEQHIARRNTANPAASFIKDPTGSGKLIKFTHPLDLRSVEEKMGGYPFNQI